MGTDASFNAEGTWTVHHSSVYHKPVKTGHAEDESHEIREQLPKRHRARNVKSLPLHQPFTFPKFSDFLIFSQSFEPSNSQTFKTIRLKSSLFVTTSVSIIFYSGYFHHVHAWHKSRFLLLCFIFSPVTKSSWNEFHGKHDFLHVQSWWAFRDSVNSFKTASLAFPWV